MHKYIVLYLMLGNEVDAHPSSVDNVCACGIHVVVVGAHVALVKLSTAGVSMRTTAPISTWAS